MTTSRESSHPTFLLSVLLLCACGGQPGPDALGRMDDTSYDRARGTRSGVSAEGDDVGVDDFEGDFLWVEHAAPWCPPCRTQAPILRDVGEDYEDVTFLVLLTATDEPFGTPTQESASAWARQHRLDPELVVAKYRNDTRTIPQHRLFSPDGQLLFYAEGQLPAHVIRDVLDERVPEWDGWDRRGDRAAWMR